MKAILEFDLSDEGDKMQHEQCIHAGEAFRALYEIRYYLRNRLKYGELDTDAQTELEDVQKLLFEWAPEDVE